MADESTFHHDSLARLERELAAVIRQYGRAADAGDDEAREVEAEAFTDRVRWLCYHHLGLRLGMSSDDWFWLNADADYRVEQVGRLEVRASGRVWCSLPDGHQKWTEPFAAEVAHAAGGGELTGYTIRLGARATLLDLATVRRLVEAGEAPAPPQPTREDAWAFVFRRGEYAEPAAAPGRGDR